MVDINMARLSRRKTLLRMRVVTMILKKQKRRLFVSDGAKKWQRVGAAKNMRLCVFMTALLYLTVFSLGQRMVSSKAKWILRKIPMIRSEITLIMFETL